MFYVHSYLMRQKLQKIWEILNINQGGLLHIDFGIMLKGTIPLFFDEYHFPFAHRFLAVRQNEFFHLTP